ncbi:murein L,D-transpeptidase family protein [Pseudorhodobacter sp.]|uniref:L,D-transpeptidase family protein n=1 Tax=Pseudorhodobacter sp. TaxID=1934400 RepID=UPI0026474CE5|nr:L,D-transpeptidase family protein [Pseudorhodobacter sp.]MDN5786115.1 L,D-transpeptidase family protein [Pseudorhodobacter sp.]
MWALKLVAALLMMIGLSSCGDSKFRSYNGPAITKVVVMKSAHKMQLYHDDKVLKTYPISLGFAPAGHKQFEGDGKTPEGLYYIDRRNPKSRYHLSLGISYPNAADVAYAKSQGKKPGGEIFIHGKTGYKGINNGDWTFGCIAVPDRKMEDIYAMVRDGTPIYLLP